MPAGSENGVDDLESRAIEVMAAHGLKGQDDDGLIQKLPLPDFPEAILPQGRGGGGEGFASRRPGGEMGADGLLGFRRIDVAHESYKSAVGDIMKPVEIEEVVPPDGLDGIFGARDGERQGILGEKGFGNEVEDITGGIDVGQRNFFEQDFPLLFNHLGGHQGVLGHIGQDVQPHLQVGGEEGDVNLRVFPMRIGIDEPAHGGDFPGNILGGPPRRPLEKEVLDEMGNPVVGSRFIPGPRPHPEVHRHRGGPRVFQNQHLHPVGQARRRRFPPRRPIRKPHPKHNYPK